MANPEVQKDKKIDQQEAEQEVVEQTKQETEELQSSIVDELSLLYAKKIVAEYKHKNPDAQDGFVDNLIAENNLDKSVFGGLFKIKRIRSKFTGMFDKWFGDSDAESLSEDEELLQGLIKDYLKAGMLLGTGLDKIISSLELVESQTKSDLKKLRKEIDKGNSSYLAQEKQKLESALLAFNTPKSTEGTEEDVEDTEDQIEEDYDEHYHANYDQEDDRSGELDPDYITTYEGKEKVGDYLAILSGTGKTLEEAKKIVYNNTEEVNFLGKTIRVHKLIKEKLEDAMREMKKEGVDYKIEKASAFNRRNVRNGDTLSYHALGLALDINYDKNPYRKNAPQGDLWKQKGTEYFDIPKGFVDIMEKHGFKWGGYWNSPFDPMHFEYKDYDYLASHSDYKIKQVA